MTKIKLEIESDGAVDNAEIHLNYKDGKTEVKNVKVNETQSATNSSSSDLFPSANKHPGIDPDFMNIVNQP